jgi:hypothetical protein
VEQPSNPRGTAAPRAYGSRRNRRILILCLATVLVLSAGILGVRKLVDLVAGQPSGKSASDQPLVLKNPLILPAQAAISSVGTGVRRRYSDFERMSIRHATIRVPD